MNTIFLLLFGVLVGLARAVPTFIVDLDLPPEQRWVQVSLAYKHILPAIMAKYEEMLKPLPVEDRAAWMKAHNVREEHLAELRGIVTSVNSSEVTLERLVLWNLMYELRYPKFSFCSGILAAEPNGMMVHGRNMDYDFPFSVDGQILDWEDVTFDVTWFRSKKPVFTSVNWPGHTGILTGMRLGGWSYQENTRSIGNSMKLNLVEAKKGSESFPFAVRKVMEEVAEYSEAVHRLESMPLMAPIYFIVAGAGPYEGTVIARDRAGYADKQVLSASKRIWHLVQTNSDRGAMCPREVTANLMLSRMGQTVMEEGRVLETLRTAPVFNPNTAYTWIAIPSTGAHRTFLSNESSLTGTFLSQPRRVSLQDTLRKSLV